MKKIGLYWKLFVHEIKDKKDGLLVGAGVGLLAAWYFINQGADLTSIAEGGKGLMDSMFNRQSSLEVARYKMFVAFGFFGAFVGYIGELLFNSLGVGKKKRKAAMRRTKRKKSRSGRKVKRRR